MVKKNSALEHQLTVTNGKMPEFDKVATEISLYSRVQFRNEETELHQVDSKISRYFDSHVSIISE